MSLSYRIQKPVANPGGQGDGLRDNRLAGVSPKTRRASVALFFDAFNKL